MSTSNMTFGRNLTVRWVRLGALLGRMHSLSVADRPAVPANPSGLLLQALAENSNRSLEWEWYAMQIEDAGEREYCLARANWIGSGF